MVAISKDFTVEAPVQRVWSALTQTEEIAGWWTDDLSVTPEVGSLAEFRFTQGTFVVQFEVAELEEGAKIRWISRRGPAPHWDGTDVTWQLTPIPNGTQIVFTHDGFAQADKRFELTRGWWEFFLSSLKSYLDTGKGTPGSAAFFKQGATKAAIVEERTIAATPERVFKALTIPEEIAGWWTDNLSATAEQGSLAEFRFRRGASVIQLEISERQQNEKVSWLPKQSPLASWEGTTITWQLTPVPDGTKVVFTQDGFALVDKHYESVRNTWQYFVDSLKSYLETGKGTPETYDHSRFSTMGQR
ncbi:MAG TPA: SRPBCC domain-containing protein [Ktedonobacteraceae bacterium]